MLNAQQKNVKADTLKDQTKAVAKSAQEGKVDNEYIIFNFRNSNS